MSSSSDFPTPGAPPVAHVDAGAAPGGLRDFVRGVWRDRNGRIGLLVTAVLAALALLAVVGAAPYDP
ncbi:MAG: hypothetical protein H0U28_03465, partial [Nocardioidaceae bacterium]|nr:hypothetical protein [Nocardioidaceae bacterium]